MSFSLPELFSASHQIVEIVREAVSSTELLHERAMERFYRAVAAEEAANETKSKSQADGKSELFERRASPLRRRLSNAGAWQAKRDRRRSSEDSQRISLKLPSIGSLTDAVSDPNLTLNKPEFSQINDDRFKRWRESGSNLLPRATDLGAYSDEILAEDSIPSSEMSSEESSDEDLRHLRARILAIPVLEEEDTYHPRGRTIIEPEKPSSPSPLVPKSILKKRPDHPIPKDKFGRPIPPEVPLQRPEVQQAEPVIIRKRSLTNPPEIDPHEPIVKLGSDQETVLSAGEAAVNRRRQIAKQSSSKSIDSEAEEQLAEERMAVVSHYTEIVKEYSMAHSPFPPSSRPSSRQGFNEPPPREVRSPSRGRSVVHPEVVKPPIPQKIVIPLEKPRIITREQDRDVQSPPRGRRVVSPEPQRTKAEPSKYDEDPKWADSKRNGTRRSVTPSTRVASRPPSRNESPMPRSRNVSRDRESGSKARRNSRPASRSSSKDRSRAGTPSEARMEKLQRALEDKQFRLRRMSESKAETNRELMMEAETNVRSTMCYVTDVTLLIAAVYVYLFKREIFAIPFIGLLLYRHVQQELRNLLPRWGQNRKH